ncbi:YSC84-related protein [uncultured Ramlibacter sp.]|uniref:lipid-binding SYLF domain-containing protein n=1 Tax=uncultured Ramlibacter sp. TaxID=260755 RepID=UPI00260EF100|nr:YSC84-related protein [uncultured Ramlibacter sp.]
MQRRKFLIVGPTLVAMGASVHAQGDSGAKRSEVREKAMLALQDFYKADPKLKDAVAKAPGYAVFTTYGLSFGLGGAAGKGVAHDKKTSKDTYMSVAQASVGLQLGASDTRYLFIFETSQALASFIDKGWDATAGASAGAGAGGSAANVGAGAGNITGGRMFALTKAGLQAGAAVSGLKAWKDKDLN